MKRFSEIANRYLTDLIIDDAALETLKKITLDMMSDLHAICEREGLRYSIAFGTMLGAVRHRGFIPWDDDIDVWMPYEDMEKFAQACQTELDTERFFYQSPQTDPEYRLTINRLRRNGTVLEEPIFADKNVHKGVFVDIYPLFGAQEGKLKRKLQVLRAMKRALYQLDEPVRNHGGIMKFGSSMLLSCKSKKGKAKAALRYTELLKKKSFDSAAYVTVLDSGIKEMSVTYRREWFGEGVDHAFEDMILRVPEDSDAILRTYYGDYMQLPPEDSRVCHHDFTKVVVPEEEEK